MIITSRQYCDRRQQLMDALPQDALVIIPAAPAALRNRDCEFPYRQNSDFWYLTGFNEPNAILVLHKKHSILFCQNRDLVMETWHGIRVGPEGAMEHYGMDQAFIIDQADELLPQWIQQATDIAYSLGSDPLFDQRMLRWLQHTKPKHPTGASPRLIDPLPVLHTLRLFKTSEEIALIRQACTISALGHQKAMQRCQPGCFEYHLEAEFRYSIMQQGARFEAYNSIIASGENACILHYTNNNQAINAQDLVLIDAGAELDNYASDITRTFPASGQFNGEQKALYEIVLEANQKAIEAVRPNHSCNGPHEVAVAVLTQGMIDLGLLKGSLNELIESKAYQTYYMHRTGHWMGLDVHDVGQYQQDGQWRNFQEGMIITVEPGLYIRKDAQCDPRWHGMGLRIEDDILVTQRGHENLSVDTPKAINEIEALMRS